MLFDPGFIWSQDSWCDHGVYFPLKSVSDILDCHLEMGEHIQGQMPLRDTVFMQQQGEVGIWKGPLGIQGNMPSVGILTEENESWSPVHCCTGKEIAGL